MFFHAQREMLGQKPPLSFHVTHMNMTTLIVFICPYACQRVCKYVEVIHVLLSFTCAVVLL